MNLKLGATATTILAAATIAAIVALTVAHIPVPTELTVFAAALAGGHLALQVPGGTVTVTTTPTPAVKAIVAAEPTAVAVVKAVDPAPTPTPVA